MNDIHSQESGELYEGSYSKDVLGLFENVYSFTKFIVAEDVCKSLRCCPRWSILRVNTSNLSRETAKVLVQEDLNLNEKRHQPGDVVARSYTVTPHPILDDVLCVCCSSQAFTGDIFPLEVIVGVQCGNAVLRGANVYAAGVMACNAGMKPGDRVSVFSDILGKCRRGMTKKFDKTKVHVANGIAVLSRAELFQENVKRGLAIRVTESVHNHPSFEELSKALFYPQNLPSVLVAHVMNPKPGDIVLDMCAAPGGKTSHLAFLLGDKGIVYANDKTGKKVAKIKATCKSLGLTNVNASAWDSTNLCLTEPLKGGDTRSSLDLAPPFPPKTFDCVLLDPPCSGLGQRPQFSCKASEKELGSYPVYQRKLFKQAVCALKPGGSLVYSTCTLSVDENENQVAWALDNFEDLQLVEQNPRLGRPGLNGHKLDNESCGLVQRFDPVLSAADAQNDYSCDNDTIAFFIAKFVRRIDE